MSRNEEIPPGISADPDKRKRSSNVQLSAGDQELLSFICESLHIRKGEAIRTAIRVYAALLKK